ncbi:unnamed protein product [Sphagnum jensenii]|uniref:Uncharacterized protein n=1 Tax=Sphagnum jensenii TaxID=128206 RepID=A0ABP1BP15_9BRYO
MKTSSGVQLKGFGNFRVNKVVPIFLEGATYYSDGSNFLRRKGGSRNYRLLFARLRQKQTGRVVAELDRSSKNQSVLAHRNAGRGYTLANGISRERRGKY